jgi:hypothetical protein
VREAIHVGDGKSARREMSRHIMHAHAILLPYLDEHGFWRDGNAS